MADELVILVYQATKSFPKEELYGLVSQARRSAVSVATKIVEGCGRRTEIEFNRYLDIAFGSLRELGYLLDLASSLGYLSDEYNGKLGEPHGRTAAALAAFIQKRDSF